MTSRDFTLCCNAVFLEKDDMDKTGAALVNDDVGMERQDKTVDKLV